jgi:hypothetical protein
MVCEPSPDLLVIAYTSPQLLAATPMRCSVSQAVSLQCKIWCSSSPAFRCRVEYLHVCLCQNFAFIRTHDYVQPLSTALRSPPLQRGDLLVPAGHKPELSFEYRNQLGVIRVVECKYNSTYLSTYHVLASAME